MKINIKILPVILVVVLRVHADDYRDWQTITFNNGERVVLSGKSINLSSIEFGNFGIAVKGVCSVPVGDIQNVFNAAVGPEVSLIYRNFLTRGFHLQLSGNYMAYTGKADQTDILTNSSIGLSGRIDVSAPDASGVWFMQFGGGITLENMTTSGVILDNIDALYTAGVGYEMPLMKGFTLLAGIDYSINPEKTITGATRDGSFFNISVGVNCVITSPKKEDEDPVK